MECNSATHMLHKYEYHIDKIDFSFVYAHISIFHNQQQSSHFQSESHLSITFALHLKMKGVHPDFSRCDVERQARHAFINTYCR